MTGAAKNVAERWAAHAVESWKLSWNTAWMYNSRVWSDSLMCCPVLICVRIRQLKQKVLLFTKGQLQESQLYVQLYVQWEGWSNCYSSSRIRDFQVFCSWEFCWHEFFPLCKIVNIVNKSTYCAGMPPEMRLARLSVVGGWDCIYLALNSLSKETDVHTPPPQFCPIACRNG